MRKLLFRGFNSKNKKWIYGFYIQNRGEHFIAPDEFATGKSWEDYKVLPETVGQYTELKDKNGKYVFEGDIVEYGLHHYAVEFDNDMSRYIVRRKNDNQVYGLDKKVLVIGNIHDNPELLKGGEE